MRFRHTSLLAADPDLFAEVDEATLRRSEPLLTVRAARLGRGSAGGFLQAAEPSTLGLLLLDGLMVREVKLGSRHCVEVLGPGDLLRPWVALGADTSISIEANWRVLDYADIAVLDDRVAEATRAWPGVTRTLMDRLVLRSRWLAFHLAVCHMRRIETRLLIVLWYFADRWGRMTPEGVAIQLPVTHALLAGVIGAQRPSVTTGLGRLEHDGLLERRSDRVWLLHGNPPAELRGAQEQAAGGPPGSA